MLLKILTSVLDIEDVNVKERGVIMVRVMMSKLKFKYSLKPKWVEAIKLVLKKGDIPQINHSLKKLQGPGGQIVMRK